MAQSVSRFAGEPREVEVVPTNRGNTECLLSVMEGGILSVITVLGYSDFLHLKKREN